jgi:RNA polymerase sigma factor (sigma-70 family)
MLHVARGAVTDFISDNPDYLQHRDDLHGEAFLALVTILRKRPRATEGYLFVSIKRALVEYVRQIPTFSVPKSTIADCKRDGRDVPELPRDESRNALHNLESDEDATVEFSEALEACCRDELDREIVELKNQGYTCEEIGEELGKSKGAVSKRWKKIAKRYRIRETN